MKRFPRRCRPSVSMENLRVATAMRSETGSRSRLRLPALAWLRSWLSGLPARLREAASAHQAVIRAALIVVGVTGLSFRLVVALWSHGSNDINLWAGFCVEYETHGSLGWLYDHDKFF